VKQVEYKVEFVLKAKSFYIFMVTKYAEAL